MNTADRSKPRSEAVPKAGESALVAGAVLVVPRSQILKSENRSMFVV